MRAAMTGMCCAVAVAAVVACQPAAPQFTDADAAIVRGMFDSTVADLNAGRFDSWAARFSDNTLFQPPNEKTVNGRTGILTWIKALPPIEQLSFSDVQVAGEGNLAYGSSAYVLKLKDIAADTGKQLAVFRRGANGTWEVVAANFNSDLPLPVPASPAAAKKG